MITPTEPSARLTAVPPASPDRAFVGVAVLTALTAAIALGVAVTTPARSGPYCRSTCAVGYPYTDAAQFVPRDYLWMYPTAALVLLVVVLAGCVHEQVSARWRRWSRIGLVFTAMAAAVLGVDYAVQLTVLQPALLRGETAGLSPWSQYHPYGLFIALENVGYTFLSLGTVLLGAALVRSSRRDRLAGWIFLAGGLVAATALVAYSVGYGTDLDYRYEVAAILINSLTLILASVALARAWSRDPAEPSPG